MCDLFGQACYRVGEALEKLSAEITEGGPSLRRILERRSDSTIAKR